LRGPAELPDVDQSHRLIFKLSFHFQIVKDDKVWYYVNGADVQESNWMRFVNCSRVEEEQNLVAYQYRGEIFYRAYKDIQAGAELLVWYGPEYATHLGIPLDGTTTQPTVNGGENRKYLFNVLARSWS
jgi:hypothetical protein